jgi:trk system potassium uptake protein TrkH
MAFTFAAESIGAALLFARWQPELGTGRAAWCAVFHSVSAFCNAGFSIWPDSLTAWRGDPMVNVVICGLIVLGGLGFVAVHEIFFNRHRQRALSVHTRLALATTVILIAGGSIMIWVLERDHTLAGMPPLDRLFASVFQSVTCRTAGFNTIDISALAPATLFSMMLLMIVGGSPGSCAGGLKTTTFAVLVLAGWNRLRHRSHVNVYYRTIPLDTVGNAIGLALTAAVLLIAGVFLLLLLESPDPEVERHGMFIGYLFETVSALGTVGLSTGVTTGLLPSSRILIVALMFLGRLGPITVASSLVRENPHTDWQYPEEGVMIG